MDASARKAQLAWINARQETLGHEMTEARARNDHEQVSHLRAVQQALAEVWSMLTQTAPGASRGPQTLPPDHDAQVEAMGAVMAGEDAPETDNARIDGGDAA